ncbi:MAG: DUF402 domain-containing protein [Bacteroidales bacterium]|nr:DUF402 domain-containing protein [Lachnoclostridium sp.]MCM1383843.1 DUF402 domain-containing protein [Lachnoclostridium sp.]MCM1464504.1 DUF402 domain-containing protein [Bacteroidales bacterium]
MGSLQIYRKRIIPQECILLKDDIIVRQNEEVIITKWKSLRPKTSFSHGCSCYFLKEGIKVSKFYRDDDSLLYWYCDIVAYEMDESANILTVTDLLTDVIIYPDGHIKVVDLDELADAVEHQLITKAQLCQSLRQLNELLTLIDRDKFDKLQAYLNQEGL